MNSATGNKQKIDGNEIQFLQVEPYKGPWKKKTLEQEFFVFGDKESFLETYGIGPNEVGYLSALDFEHFYLVSVQQGLCPTGGYRIQVHKVQRFPDKVEITLSFKKPKSKDLVTMIMTTPHVYFLVPRQKGETVPPTFYFYSPDGRKLATRKPLFKKSTKIPKKTV